MYIFEQIEHRDEDRGRWNDLGHQVFSLNSHKAQAEDGKPADKPSLDCIDFNNPENSIVDRRPLTVFPDHRRIVIEDGPEAYKTFRDKKDGCIKVVIRPNG